MALVVTDSKLAAPRRSGRPPGADARVGRDTGGEDRSDATPVTTDEADGDADGDASAGDREQSAAVTAAGRESVKVSEPERGRRVIEVGLAPAPERNVDPSSDEPLPTTTLTSDNSGRSSRDLWVTGAVALAVGAAGLGSLVRGERALRRKG